MPDIHLEVFPEKQLIVWDELRQHADALRASGLYLAGGSALALQVGHRQSVDLDFFSQKKGISREAFDGWIQNILGCVVREMDTNTIHGDIKGVKISIIGGYKYPLIKDTVDADGLQIASIYDIGAMKLLAITHRAALRDYIDIAVIIRDHYSLEELLEASTKKHGSLFDPMVPLRALVSFQDLDSEMPYLLDATLEHSWQDIITDSVKRITESGGMEA